MKPINLLWESVWRYFLSPKCGEWCTHDTSEVCLLLRTNQAHGKRSRLASESVLDFPFHNFSVSWSVRFLFPKAQFFYFLLFSGVSFSHASIWKKGSMWREKRSQWKEREKEMGAKNCVTELFVMLLWSCFSTFFPIKQGIDNWIAAQDEKEQRLIRFTIWKRKKVENCNLICFISTFCATKDTNRGFFLIFSEPFSHLLFLHSIHLFVFSPSKNTIWR